MKVSDVVSGIVVFFNDLIGAVIPGLALLSGLYWLDAYPESITGSGILLKPPFDWLLPIALAYAAGHGLIGIHRLLESIFIGFLRGARSLVLQWKWDTRPYQDKVSEEPAYKQFQSDIMDRHRKEFPDSNICELEKLRFHDLRNIAMTISSEGGDLARRFMFISLFCYGIAMAVLVLGIYYLVDRITMYDLTGILKGIFIAIIFFVFYFRGLAFGRRALSAPFSVALAELIAKSAGNGKN